MHHEVVQEHEEHIRVQSRIVNLSTHAEQAVQSQANTASNKMHSAGMNTTHTSLVCGMTSHNIQLGGTCPGSRTVMRSIHDTAADTASQRLSLQGFALGL